MTTAAFALAAGAFLIALLGVLAAFGAARRAATAAAAAEHDALRPHLRYATTAQHDVRIGEPYLQVRVCNDSERAYRIDAAHLLYECGDASKGVELANPSAKDLLPGDTVTVNLGKAGAVQAQWLHLELSPHNGWTCPCDKPTRSHWIRRYRETSRLSRHSRTLRSAVPPNEGRHADVAGTPA